jgi:hypothetical protein
VTIKEGKDWKMEEKKEMILELSSENFTYLHVEAGI